MEKKHTDTSRPMVTTRYPQGSYNPTELRFVTLPENVRCSGVNLLMLWAIRGPETMEKRAGGELNRDQDENGDGDIHVASGSQFSLFAQPTGIPFYFGCPHIYHILVDSTVFSLVWELYFGILRLSHHALLITELQQMFLEGFWRLCSNAIFSMRVFLPPY